MSKRPEPEYVTDYLPEGVDISKIVCGSVFTIFITSNKDIYGCGINDLGQLGLETHMQEMQIAVLDRAKGMNDVITTDVTRPSPIICFEGMDVNNVSCGENHSLALISLPGSK